MYTTSISRKSCDEEVVPSRCSVLHRLSGSELFIKLVHGKPEVVHHSSLAFVTARFVLAE